MLKDQHSAAFGGSGVVITLVDHALILPRYGKGGFAVVDGQGAPVVDAVTFRKDGYEYSDFVDRDLPRKTRTLTGTCLYAATTGIISAISSLKVWRGCGRSTMWTSHWMALSSCRRVAAPRWKRPLPPIRFRTGCFACSASVFRSS